MLPRVARVSRSNDWQRLQRYGKTSVSPGLIIKYSPNNLPISRFGFSVGKKISKKSVVRNKIKRQLRAIIQRLKPDLQGGYDVVLLSRLPIAGMDYRQKFLAVETLLRKVRILVK